MKSSFIAFHGFAGSGKTTAADYVAAGFFGCRPVHRISFAHPIRKMLRALGLSEWDLKFGKNIPHSLLGGKTPREAMQTLGTEWGRALVSPDIWADALQIEIIAWRVERPAGVVIIDDCRFENEARLVHDLGGRVIAIARPGLGPMDHASERGLPADMIDATVLNDCDLDEFHARVLSAVGL